MIFLFRVIELHCVLEIYFGKKRKIKNNFHNLLQNYIFGKKKKKLKTREEFLFTFCLQNFLSTFGKIWREENQSFSVIFFFFLLNSGIECAGACKVEEAVLKLSKIVKLKVFLNMMLFYYIVNHFINTANCHY